MGTEKTSFGCTKDGRKVTKYILTNANGMKVSFIDLGAVIVNMWVPDRNGKFEDVVLGYDRLEDYEVNVPSFGCPVGRCANRISNGEFMIQGIRYPLEQNDDTNCLHGGFLRFNYLMYVAECFQEEGMTGITFSRVSPDGEQGFPGNFTYAITYQLTDQNELIIHYEGVSDQDTVVNLTNHSYFNLGPEGNHCKNVLSQEVCIAADRYTPTNSRHLPTGEILPVDNTPFDFREFKVISDNLAIGDSSGNHLAGFDHNYVLDHEPGDIILAAQMRDSRTGRLMKVYTNQPGIQLYTAPELENERGKGGMVYGHSAAACFETQNYPNAVNTPEFPGGILAEGEAYDFTTIFAFSTY